MKSLPSALLVVPLLAALGSCSITPPERPLPATFAFPIRVHARAHSPSIPPLVLFPVRAPSWLATRLLYVRHAGGLRIAAHRRAVWIAPLPGLFDEALRATLIPHERAGAARIALHVRLFDLEETVSAQTARVALVARTRLASLRLGVPSRVHLWRLTVKTRPGARDEARAILLLDRRFNTAVLRWLVRRAEPRRGTPSPR